MSRSLDDLNENFKRLVFEFLARLTEAGIPVMIVSTGRTKEEQAENIRKGVSWTKNSMHLPQPPDNKAKAIDICPYSAFNLHGSGWLMWDAKDPVWAKIGAIGESLGLVWGGRWKKTPDYGHFQESL